jgi:Ca2+-binding RTX toxin-like protein
LALKKAICREFQDALYDNDFVGLSKKLNVDGDDTLTGGLGNDSLYGGDGNDSLNGDSGSVGIDRTFGGNGNDRIADDDGVNFDIHDGGTDVDTIDYSSVTFGTGFVTINLTTSLTSVTAGSTETHISHLYLYLENWSPQVASPKTDFF